MNHITYTVLRLCFCPDLEIRKADHQMNEWRPSKMLNLLSFITLLRWACTPAPPAAVYCLQRIDFDPFYPSLTLLSCSYPFSLFQPVSNENSSRVFWFNFPPIPSIFNRCNHISLSHQCSPPWLLNNCSSSFVDERLLSNPVLKQGQRGLCLPQCWKAWEMCETA